MYYRKHQDPKFKQKLDLDSQAQKTKIVRKTCKIVFDLTGSWLFCFYLMSGLALSQLSWRLRALSSRLEKLSC
jgi:hypothetical protein